MLLLLLLPSPPSPPPQHPAPPAHRSRVPRAGTRLPGALQLRGPSGSPAGREGKGSERARSCTERLSKQQIPQPAPPGSHSPGLGEETGGQPKKGPGAAGSGVANLLRLYFNRVNYAEPCSFRARTARALSHICGDPARALAAPFHPRRGSIKGARGSPSGTRPGCPGARHGPFLGKTLLEAGRRIWDS